MATAHPRSRRETRERDLVAATRALFDQRGMQDAPIEEIAQAVGIARGLIYRQFSSKEELFVLTVTDYLAELAVEIERATASAGEPVARLRACIDAYARFCARYPAFLDCSLSLMHRPARELQEMLSESVWLRLGQGMARCIGQLTELLRAGREAGAFSLDDADHVAHVLWTQILGSMHLARTRVGVRQATPGVPELFRIDVEQLIETCVASALATVGAQPGRRPSDA